MKFLLALALSCCGIAAHAEIVIKDDSGVTLRLAAPAKRIISLAPHVTEVLFAAGAGERIVGTVDYSDYPEAAKRLPRIGGYERVDLEALASLKPDLVIAWQSGNVSAHVDKIKALGIPVYTTQPDRIDDVARSLEGYGRLAGSEAVANKAAAALRTRLAALRARYGAQPPVRVFYEVWKQPLTTINDKQIISDAIRLCGGVNIFAALPALAPTVSAEAVLAADPEAIVASGMDEARPEWLDDWKRWPQLTAVKRGNLFHIPPGLIQRHTPRLLDGAEMLCGQLEQARARRVAK
ncbi:MAG TPA: cobalamin-binding protein [Rhodocyclaceae bacterium]